MKFFERKSNWDRWAGKAAEKAMAPGARKPALAAGAAVAGAAALTVVSAAISSVRRKSGS